MDRINYPLSNRNYFHTAIWLTQEAGLFEAEGLAVALDYAEPGVDKVDLVRTGRAPASTLGLEHVLADRAAGRRDLVAIGGMINGLPFSLIAQPSIRSIAELRGKAIGVSSLDYGSSGLVVRHLAAYGLVPGDYRLVAAGDIEKRWRLLRSGEIDAGLQAAPLNFVATDAGFSDLGTLASTFPRFQFLAVVANARWAQENRPVAVRLLRAILRGIAFYHADRDRVNELVARRMELSPSQARRAWEAYVAHAILPRDGAVDAAGAQAVIDMRTALHGAGGKSAVADLVDGSYLAEAVRSLAEDRR